MSRYPGVFPPVLENFCPTFSPGPTDRRWVSKDALVSALPASEDVLIRFCCHLADTLHHSSIKVYLSAIRSLHIEEGIPSPLVGYLRLQRVLLGIKRHEGSNRRQHQPITIELMHIISQSLNFSDYNHTMICYTSHTFRSGAATSAASCGLPDHLIKTLGRLSSDAYQIYINTPVSTIVGVASLLT